MTSRLHTRALAFVLAAAATLALLGSVDQLAGREPASQWLARAAAASTRG